MKGKYMFKLNSSICFFPVFYGKKARLFYFVFMASYSFMSCPEGSTSSRGRGCF